VDYGCEKVDAAENFVFSVIENAHYANFDFSSIEQYNRDT
jgi:hypothetical protein